MRSPMETLNGRIVDYNPATGEVTIKAYYDDPFTMLKREYRSCLVQMVDGRPLSDRQRKACFAMIRSIADYTGMGVEETKQWMKLKFLAEDLEETADKIFSLSNASMSLVCCFQQFLVDFILSWSIPTPFPMIDMVNDIDGYIYSCLRNIKCCVCGKPADLHHVDAVGRGYDRKEIVHEGMRALPLCREHHTEMHTIGKEKFDQKYHVGGGIPLDKTLCKIYNLKAKKEGELIL